MKEVIIYTDGACRNNPGIGGWGAVLRSGGLEREIMGSEQNTTNNRMELRAAIEALKSLNYRCSVVLYTDSIYVRDGIDKWLQRWKSNNWRTKARKPVKNQDLWEQLDGFNTMHKVHWCWVKGHSGDEGNERADALANRAIDARVSVQ